MQKDDRISKTHSTTHEDKMGISQLAREPKFRPRTKHMAAKHHHFRNAASRGQIKIFTIDAKNQQADVFAKTLPKPQFESYEN